jgi:hypothetical protein
VQRVVVGEVGKADVGHLCREDPGIAGRGRGQRRCQRVAETAPAREQHYRALLQSALPPGTGPHDSHTGQWLHRTLRAAELAGLDQAEVLARAVAERDLTGARDIPAVIDARIRRRHGDLIPLPAPPWSAQIPQTDDPERQRFFAHLAAVMDDRRSRIGEHAVATSPAWAVTALGPVPGDPAARQAWQHAAAAIGTYRELSGHASPDDPIGPEPAANSPDLRAAWHEARAAREHEPIGAKHSRQGNESRPSRTAIDLAEASRLLGELAAQRDAAAELADRQRPTARDTIPRLDRAGPAIPLGPAQRRTAILQPPAPEIPPSPWILERAAERNLEPEAGG